MDTKIRAGRAWTYTSLSFSLTREQRRPINRHLSLKQEIRFTLQPLRRCRTKLTRVSTKSGRSLPAKSIAAAPPATTEARIRLFSKNSTLSKGKHTRSPKEFQTSQSQRNGARIANTSPNETPSVFEPRKVFTHRRTCSHAKFTHKA